MKKLMIVLISMLVLSSCATTTHFCGTTKHKPIKRMSKRQVNNAKKGKPMYAYKNGKIKKNRGW